ncbi:MAG: hypothetical protein IKR97_02110 [Eubacterium sp.]|nr:hypothetical protein [Eubacterium sp.]
MKKIIAILLCILIVAASFAACKSNKGGSTDSTAGLNEAVNEYGFETVEVTDKNGKAVTEKNGEKATTQIAVLYEKDKNGKTVAKVLDENGDVMKDKNGKEVTVKTDYDIDDSADITPETKKTKKGQKTTEEKIPTTKEQKTTASTTKKADKGEATTQKEVTTIDYKKDKVPTISEALKSKSKKAVAFDSYDQQIVKSMLEVPYLYTSSYENKDGVPIELATHAALWMAERESLNTSTYASGTIVLDLFKFFGQTVVNFKSKCNDEGNNEKIKYNKKNDTFTITDFENPKQTVSLKKIEFIGNNNYYLVTADVENAGKYKTVYAIIQKNKLDIGLGFSIKALKWK